MTAEDFRRAFETMPAPQHAHLHQTLGLSGRGSRRLGAKLLRAHVRRVDHEGAKNLAGALADPVFTQFEMATQDPAVLDASTIAAAVARWGPRLVELAFHAMWEFDDIDETTRDQLCRTLGRLTLESGDPAVTAVKEARSPTSFGLMRLLHDEVLRPDADRPSLEEAIDYLVRLDPQCPTWHYLDGLLADDRGPDPLVTSSEAVDLQLARLVGNLERMSVRDPAELQRVVAALPEAVVNRMARMHEASHVVRAFLDSAEDDPDRVRELVALLPVPFNGWEEFVRQAIGQVDPLGSPDDAVVAEALLATVEQAVSRWADEAREDVAFSAPSLTVARVRCRRARNDFAGARRLLGELDESIVAHELAAAVALERALAIAEVRSPETVRFPQAEGDMARLVRSLGPVRTDLLAVIDADPANAFAHLLLGLLLHCEEDPGAAAHLKVALSHFEETLGTEAPLVNELRFVSGLAQLRLLEPGTENGAYSSISTALEAGYIPSPVDVAAAVQALDVHDSRHVGTFLRQVRQSIPRDPSMLAVLAERARSGDEECLALAEELAGHQQVTVAGRVELLGAALLGAQVTGDAERAERVVYALDDALVRASRKDLDEGFAEALATLDIVRTALGHATEGLRIEVLRRTGNLDEAAALARQMFFRANAGALPPEFDAEDLLLLLAELGTADDELDSLRRLLARRTVEQETSAPLLPGSVRVVFVGGNETQRRYVAAVEDALRSRFDERVAVDWFLTGWRTNWPTELDRIVAAFDNAGAVVVMTFVRTQLGQHVRRRAGEHGLPWVACTGHGRDSLIRALDRAARLAASAHQPGSSAAPEEGRSGP